MMSCTGELVVVTTAWPFIELNDEGRAFVHGTKTKVLEIAECHLAYHWDADQIHRQLSGLTLPQIHAALGYYFENKPECDRQLQGAHDRAEELRREFEDTALLQKLRGKLTT